MMRGARASWTDGAIFALLAGALVFVALHAPFNHDEDQHLAAARLVPGLRPFVDFPYLQTPLFPYWGSWIVDLVPRYAMVAARVSQALLASLVCWIGFRLTAGLTGSRLAACASMLAMVCSYPFLHTASIFRNDMLPLLLETVALTVLLPHARKPADLPLTTLAATGALIGLAASAKVTFGALGVAPLLWLMTERGIDPRRRMRMIAALGIGGLAGLLPALVPLALAPERVWFQVVTFNAQGPKFWLPLIGQGERLTLAGRLHDVSDVLFRGPQAIALLAAAGHRAALAWRRGEQQPDGALLRLLDWFVVFALLAALVPSPTYGAYFVLLFPPLFIRLPFAVAATGGALRTVLVAALGLFALLGIEAFADMSRSPGDAAFPRQSCRIALGRSPPAGGGDRRPGGDAVAAPRDLLRRDDRPALRQRAVPLSLDRSRQAERDCRGGRGDAADPRSKLYRSPASRHRHRIRGRRQRRATGPRPGLARLCRSARLPPVHQSARPDAGLCRPARKRRGGRMMSGFVVRPSFPSQVTERPA